MFSQQLRLLRCYKIFFSGSFHCIWFAQRASPVLTPIMETVISGCNQIVSNFSRTQVCRCLGNQRIPSDALARRFPTKMVPVQQQVAHGGLQELILQECYDQTVAQTWSALLPQIEHLVVSVEITDAGAGQSHICRCWPSLVSLEIIYHRMDAVNFNSTRPRYDESRTVLTIK